MLELIFQESHDLLLKQYILGGVSIEYKLLGKKSKTMFSIIISPNEIYEYLKPKEEEARRMKAVYRAIKRQADESNRIK